MGACECGRLTYRIADNEPLLAYACHCLHCQTRSGSAFSQQILVPDASVVFEGQTASSARESGNGQVEEAFCATCLTRIYNRNSGLEGVVLLYAGTLSESHGVKPFLHMWTRRKQPWIVLDDSLPSFETSPSPEEFGQALAKARAG